MNLTKLKQLFAHGLWISLLLGFSTLTARPLDIQLHSESAILINADTGAILYKKNSHQLMAPASVTKIATAIYTLERGGVSLESVATADQECVGFVSEAAKKHSNYTMPSHYLEHGAKHMVIHKGERLTLRDLLYGMMVHSADDASNVIALHVGGTIPRFMTQLNAYLSELGCTHTNFNNPHGLYHPLHQTTAYDLALLCKHAMSNPTFREIVATTQWTRPATEHQQAISLLQSNQLLRKGKYYYPRAIGIKTGWTTASGYTLCAAAQHEGRTLIAVLLKAPERHHVFQDAIDLFNLAFNEPLLERQLFSSGPISQAAPVQDSLCKIAASLEEPVVLHYYASEEPEITASVQWDELTLPVRKGQHVGRLVIASATGQLIEEVPLYAAGNLSTLWRWTAGWRAILLTAGIAFVLLVLVGSGLQRRRRPFG